MARDGGNRRLGPIKYPMKITANVFWLVCLSALLLVGCGGNVVLDNPRSEAVVFTFDGSDAHPVGPNAMESISLASGKHAVVVKTDGGRVLGDTTFNLKDGGIVHSGANGYVVWRQLYGVSKERKTLLNEDWTMVDSTRFFGDIKVFPANGLFLDKNWDLGLTEPLPESTTLYVNSDYKVETKVFREPEFITTYRELSDKNKKDN